MSNPEWKDWNISEEKGDAYEGLTLNWYFPRTMGGNTTEALGFMYPHNVTPEKAQAHLRDVFGRHAILVGIKGRKPDMLNGWRCEDVRFEWVDENETPEANGSVS